MALGALALTVSLANPGSVLAASTPGQTSETSSVTGNDPAAVPSATPAQVQAAAATIPGYSSFEAAHPFSNASAPPPSVTPIPDPEADAASLPDTTVESEWTTLEQKGDLPSPATNESRLASAFAEAPAAAKIPSSVPAGKSFGFSDAPGQFLTYYNSSDYQQLESGLGIVYVRFSIGWDAFGTYQNGQCVDDSSGAYSSSQLSDQQALYEDLAAAASQGELPLIVLSGFHFYSLPDVSSDPYDPDLNQYQCGLAGLMNTIHNVWKDGDAFTYELYNEPDLNGEDAQDAASLWSAFAYEEALNKWNDVAEVGSFGTAAMDTGSTTNSYEYRYFRDLYDYVVTDCDEANWCAAPGPASGHSYDDVDDSYQSGNDTAETSELVNQVNTAAPNNFFSGLPIWITEAAVGETYNTPAPSGDLATGCPSGPGHSDPDPDDSGSLSACVDDSATHQANAAKGFLNLIQVSQVDAVFWYNFVQNYGYDSALVANDASGGDCYGSNGAVTIYPTCAGQERPAFCVLVNPSWTAAQCAADSAYNDVHVAPAGTWQESAGTVPNSSPAVADTQCAVGQGGAPYASFTVTDDPWMQADNPESSDDTAVTDPCWRLTNGQNLAPPSASASLSQPGTLTAYQALWTSNSYQAVMQSDGNFVVYNNIGSALWSAGTSGNPGAYLSLQSDGNLVIETSGGSILWQTGTNGSSGDLLSLATSGSLELTSSGGQEIWTDGPPPTITSESAQPGTPSSGVASETVMAQVTTNGAPNESVTVNYGPTGALGSTSSAVSIPNGQSSATVTLTLGGLSLGTTYDYQVVVHSLYGLADGPLEQFTSTGLPVIGSGSTTVTEDNPGVSLGGAFTESFVYTPNALGVTNAYIQYGTSSSYGTTVAAGSTNATSGSDETPVTSSPVAVSGINPGTTIFYQYYATNGSGTSYGPAESFTIPITTVGGIAFSGGTTGVSAAMTVSTAGTSSGDTIQISYGTSASYGQTATLAAASGIATLANLTPGAVYDYAVSLLASNGSTIQTVTGSFGTPATPELGPVTSSASGSGLTITVPVNPEDGATTVTFEAANGAATSHPTLSVVATRSLAASLKPTTETVTLQMTCDEETYWSVTAANAAGSVGASGTHLYTCGGRAPGAEAATASVSSTQTGVLSQLIWSANEAM